MKSSNLFMTLLLMSPMQCTSEKIYISSFKINLFFHHPKSSCTLICVKPLVFFSVLTQIKWESSHVPSTDCAILCYGRLWLKLNYKNNL